MNVQDTGSTSHSDYSRSENIIYAALDRHRRAATLMAWPDKPPNDCVGQAAAVAALLRVRFNAGSKLLICGNGGSAMDAQHFAAELVVRYKKEREGLPAIALTADQAVLTACANDYSYERVFSRQVVALGRPGDILICFSTSGNSPNVVLAANTARDYDLFVISFTGEKESLLSLPRNSDWCIRAPSDETARVQEMHQILYHGICEALDELYSD